MMAKNQSFNLILLGATLLLSVAIGPQSAFAEPPANDNRRAATPKGAAARSTNENEVVIARTAFNNQVLELTVPESTLEQRRAASPRALRDLGKEQLLENLKVQCGHKKGVIKEVLHDFVPDAGAFYAGLAMTAETQLQKDPAAFRHFAEQNLLDPMAHVSFAFFMLGSSSTQAALGLMGLHFDPCTRLRDGNLFVTKSDPLTGKKEYGMRPTKLQKRAQILVGPLSMSGGFLLSSMVHEFVADPNIWMCAKGLYSEMKPEEMDARNKACDTAYEDWVQEGKIKNYVPDLLSMIGTSFIQGYLINAPASAAYKKLGEKLEQRIPGLMIRAAQTGRTSTLRIALGAFKIIQVVGSAHPVVQFGMKAVNALIFVSINEVIVPYFKFPWERRQQGTKITSSMNEIFDEIARTEKNGWVWKPKPKPEYCDTYQPSAMDIANGFGEPIGCNEETVEIDKLIRKLGDRYKKWREFVLADAYMAHSNWKDYLTRFQHKYTDSYRFYNILLQSIAWKKTPNARPDELVEKLYSASPFNGLDIKVPSKVCELTPEDAQKIKDAETIARAAIEERKSGKTKARIPLENEWLEKIAVGLEAADCSKPISGARESLQQARDQGATVSKDEWAAMDNEIRMTRFGAAMDTLTKALDKKSIYSDFGLNPKSKGYADLAAWNPFAKLKAVLGSPKPLPVGIELLQELDKNPQVITQEFKQDHPGGVGFMARGRTSTMTDYLLAQMVCGPEADPRNEIKIKVYNEQKQSKLTKVLNYMVSMFSGGLVDSSEATRQLDDQTSMVFVQYAYEDAAAPKADWSSNSSDLALIPNVWGIRADFRPPRIITDVKYDFCADHRKGEQLNYSDWDIHTTEFNVNGEKVQGYLGVVKKYARTAIVGTDMDTFRFREWWDQQVDSHMVRVIDLFRKDFEHIIQTDFIPKFVSTDSTVYNNRRFESGVAKSLESEARFNLTLLGKAYLRSDFDADNGGSRAARAKFNELADEFLKHLRLQTMLFSDLATAQKAVTVIETIATGETAKRAPKARFVQHNEERFSKAFEANKAILGQIIDDLGKLTNAKVTKVESKLFASPKTADESQSETPAADRNASAEALQTLTKIREASLGNLTALVTETDSYFGVVDTIRVEGLK